MEVFKTDERVGFPCGCIGLIVVFLMVFMLPLLSESEFVTEQEQVIYYEGEEVGTRRSDFIVEGNIMVELKALINLEDVHLAQAKNYVVAYDLPVGLLINFGSTSLQYKKVFNPKYNHPSNPPIL